MPIVPRFARQTDPNAVQTHDFAGALQEGMLAGSQLKRTKLAEEEMKQRGDVLGMQIQDRADAKAVEQDIATLETGKSQIPPNAQPEDYRLFFEQKILPSIKTPKGRAIAEADYREGRSQMLVDKASGAAIDSLADTIRKASLAPGAEDFSQRYIDIAGGISKLGDKNLPAAEKYAQLQFYLKSYGEVQKAQEDLFVSTQQEVSAQAELDAMQSMVPVGSPGEAQVAQIRAGVVSGRLTPRQGLRLMSAVKLGEVPFTSPGGVTAFVAPEDALRMEREFAELQMEREKAAATLKAMEERARQAEERLQQGAERIKLEGERIEQAKIDSDRRASKVAFSQSDITARMKQIELDPKMATMGQDAIRAEAERQLFDEDRRLKAGGATAIPSAAPPALPPAIQAMVDKMTPEERAVFMENYEGGQ